MNAWILTLLFIAALVLLPSWLIGSAALSAALALWIASKSERRKQQQRAHEEVKQQNRLLLGLCQRWLHWAEAQEKSEQTPPLRRAGNNVVQLRRKS